jgi:hypothetical protein
MKCPRCQHANSPKARFCEACGTSRATYAGWPANGLAGALTVLASSTFLNERRRLVDLAAKNHLPAVSVSRDFDAPLPTWTKS